MKVKTVTCLGALALMVACAAPPAIQRPVIEVAATFNKAEAEAALAPGSGVIRGSAMIRQVGGGVVTCAGTKVYLIPVNAYSAERMTKAMGSENGGYETVLASPPIFPNSPVDYARLQRTVICDPQGKFEFDNLAEGEFFIGAAVVWEVRGPQGGFIVKRVRVTANRSVNVVLTAN